MPGAGPGPANVLSFVLGYPTSDFISRIYCGTERERERTLNYHPNEETRKRKKRAYIPLLRDTFVARDYSNNSTNYSLIFYNFFARQLATFLNHLIIGINNFCRARMLKSFDEFLTDFLEFFSPDNLKNV